MFKIKGKRQMTKVVISAFIIFCLSAPLFAASGMDVKVRRTNDPCTQNNIVYPPKDPAVFEVKFPDSDIKGLVV